MNSSVPLRLEFGEDVPSPVRARMSYVFRVFAAVYGHKVVDREQSEDSLCCIYGKSSARSGWSNFRHLPARYGLRRSEDPAPPPTESCYAKQKLYLFHGRDEVSGNPDWLGEIFEWLSSAHELSVRERDSVGRIPYEQSVFARHKISPLRPHASLIMAWLQNFINGAEGSENLPPAPSPLPDVDHLVISSHDIDFYFTGWRESLVRVLKNLGIAVVGRSYPFFKDTVRQLLRIVRGERVGDFLPELLKRSQEHSFSSTFFVLAQSEHRRDGNYALKQIAHRLRKVPKGGSSLALHGSYRSIVENSDLESEAAVLEAEMDERPRGSRQHWLRFDRQEKLFANIKKAGLQYDSSWGWAEQLGFRNGAAFAFPPYDFAREQAHDFLLIPLAIMDRGLQTSRRESPERPAELAAAVLDESRRWGWGGISVLWHNPIEPLSVCDDVNQIFWRALKNKAQRRERWISAEEFMNISLSRYQQAGLLNSMRPDLKATFGDGAKDCIEQAGHDFDVATLTSGLHPSAVQYQKCR